MYTDPTGHKEGNWWDPRTHIAAVKKVLTSVYNSEVRLAKAAVALGKTAVSNPSGAIAAWNNPLETTEAINQTVLKPMVTQDLGVKENSTAYKAIKFVGLRTEGAAITVSNTSTGIVHGGILVAKTACDDIAYGLVEGSHALGLFGLDDESLYESVHNEMYNRVSENANQWMAIPGQIWDDAKYMFNKNNIDNYYFNPNLPLQDVAHWQQSVVNTNLAVYSIFDTGLLIKGKVANFRSGFSDAYSAIKTQTKRIATDNGGSWDPYNSKAGKPNAGVGGNVKNVTQKKTLIHYTDETGMNGILESKQLNPSLKANNPKDAYYGNGQYLSDIQPGTKTPAQLSRTFINNPFQGKRFSNYVEIDVTDLNPVMGRDGVYVIPNETPLDLTGRIVSSGKVGK